MKLNFSLILTVPFLVCSLNIEAFEKSNSAVIYGNYSIEEVVNKGDGKLVIRSLTENASGQIKQHGDVIMEIRTDDLPITMKDCDEIYADTCDLYSKRHTDSYCKKSCINEWPELVAFNEKDKIVYFSTPTTANGSAGQFYFVFSANLIDKKIKKIKNQFNLDKANLSPSGRYLVFNGTNVISIYDTKTDEIIRIKQKNNWSPDHKRFYVLDVMKWLNDTQFIYQEGVKHAKFQPSYDEKNEITYDLGLQKKINTRVMAKTEYNSKPYI